MTTCKLGLSPQPKRRKRRERMGSKVTEIEYVVASFNYSIVKN